MCNMGWYPLLIITYPFSRTENAGKNVSKAFHIISTKGVKAI